MSVEEKAVHAKATLDDKFNLNFSSKLDIFFCIDEERNCAVEISSSSLNNDRQLNGNKKWCSLVAGTRSMFARNNHSAKGILQLKLRQLNILGYHSILIPWFNYVQLNRADRLKYLRTKFDQCYILSENKIVE